MNWFRKNPNGLEVEAALRAALSSVIDPRTGKDVLTTNFVTSAAFSDGDGGAKVTITVELPGGPSPLNDKLQAEIKSQTEAVDGITKAIVVATAHKAKVTPDSPRGGHANPLGVEGSKVSENIVMPFVRRIVAVASGKGGVGKSTVAANLAVAFAQAGYRVGLMDADIYGPSLPVLFGLKQKAAFADGQIQPTVAFGVKLMSIGLLIPEEKAIAWRGPMVMGAVQQLFTEVNWGELDILLIDTPPGTGDAHLTLLQKTQLSGAVIVSTPQEMALADVRRGAALFRQMDTPVLGLIENMAYLDQPDGERLPLFGEGGARKAAEELDVPFLGEVPLIPLLRAASDSGTPLGAYDPDNPNAEIFRDLARKVADKLSLVPGEQAS